MKVRLNLSTTPQENRRPFLAASVLIAVVGVAALVLLSRAAYSSWQANRQVRSTIAGLQSRIRRSAVEQSQLATYFHTPQAREIMDRANFLNSLIDQRSFPWTDIFASLERTLPDGVRVVSISPKLVNGRAQLALTIGAVNDQQKISFLKAMESSKSFANLQILAEKHDSKADSLDQVLIELSVEYQAI